MSIQQAVTGDFAPCVTVEAVTLTTPAQGRDRHYVAASLLGLFGTALHATCLEDLRGFGPDLLFDLVVIERRGLDPPGDLVTTRVGFLQCCHQQAEGIL